MKEIIPSNFQRPLPQCIDLAFLSLSLFLLSASVQYLGATEGERKQKCSNWLISFLACKSSEERGGLLRDGDSNDLNRVLECLWTSTFVIVLSFKFCTIIFICVLAFKLLKLKYDTIFLNLLKQTKFMY